MTRQALVGAKLYVDRAWREDHALLLSGQLIEAVCPVSQLPAEVTQEHLNGGFLMPGFIDTQVNGGGGALFNDDPTIAGIQTIAAAHRRFGTTGFLPTLISDDLSVVASAISAVDAAIAGNVPGVLGLHLEGPFLNSDKRGIHDARKFRTLDADMIELIASLKHGKIIVTLAPELADAQMIKSLVAKGIIVAAGHSLATYDQMQTAFLAGLLGITHLFNAMSQMESRAPGIVGAALDHPACMAGLIADGHHVHPASMRVALAALSCDRLMLVTDAMPSVGSVTKSYMIGDQLITVADGICRAADGTLAGSDLDMATAVRNAMTLLHVDLASASHMASATPAAYLGMTHVRGKLAAGLQADIVHMDNTYQVTSTWIGSVREDVA